MQLKHASCTCRATDSQQGAKAQESGAYSERGRAHMWG